MSFVGINFGNEKAAVAGASDKSIFVVPNDESKGKTPTIICFGEKQRFIGTAGAAAMLTNPVNSISQIKQLIGRPFCDPDLQRDIKGLPFSVTEGPDGFPLVHTTYLGEKRSFTPTQIMGMMMSNLKGMAEKNLSTVVDKCCIGIPVYFNDLQRRAVMDAATIAGLRPLRLMHETTSTALAYSLYRNRELSENGQLNVAFVDIGHLSMQVCIARYEKAELKILAHSFDRCLGGRDFDEVLFNYFAANFKEEYKIDVCQNVGACNKLRAACQKLKEVLTANPDASMQIKGLVEDKNVQGFIKREEFESLIAPKLTRVKSILRNALTESGLSVNSIHSVEVVGSGSLVPAISKSLIEFFGKEPRRTMNIDSVSMGCAMQCDVLLSKYKTLVEKLQVNDIFPFPISLSWKDSDVTSESQQSTEVFPRGSPISIVKPLTLYQSGTFSVDVLYGDVSKLQEPAKISTYTIGPFQSPAGVRPSLRVEVLLNMHGIVSIESATLLEEEEVDVQGMMEPSKEALELKSDETLNNTASTGLAEADINIQDSKCAAKSQEVENSVPESGKKRVRMEADVKLEAPKRVKNTSIPVTEKVYGALSHNDLQKAVEEETEMACHDQLVEDTRAWRNKVEAYVNDMWRKLDDQYREFVTPADKEEFLGTLHEAEDWLLWDVGECETKEVYIAKFEELKKQGGPIEERYTEHMNRATEIEEFYLRIEMYRHVAESGYAHIDTTGARKILDVCAKAEAWLREKKEKQDCLPKHASSPVLRSADVKDRTKAVTRSCYPIAFSYERCRRLV